MSWSNWENPRIREHWNPLLDRIEGVVRALAEHAGLNEAKIQRCHSDAPDVTLSWKDGDLARNLNVLILSQEWPTSLLFSGNVWRDSVTGRVHNHISPWIPNSYASLADFEKRIDRDLSDSFAYIAHAQLQMALTASGDRLTNSD